MTHKILIIEDEFIIATDLQQKLGRLGYDASNIVSSGEDALELLKIFRPDIILMDIVLAGRLNGIETAAKIKNEWKIPLIYTTSNSDQELFERAKRTEPYGYITKPYEIMDLKRGIDIALYKSKLEREKDEMFLQLSHAARLASMGTMASSIIHDLSSPLAMIKGYVHLIRRCQLATDVADMIEKVNKGVDRMEDLVVHLKSFVRRDNDIKIKNLDLNQPIKDILSLLNSTLLHTTVTVIEGEDALIKGNSTQIESIVQNLITNSVDAFNERKIEGREIKISTKTEKDKVFLIYEDNAGGIPPEIEHKILEPFFTTKETKGTGLGLAIISRIVEQMGGLFQVVNRHGKGVVFFLSFPAATGAEKAVEAAPIAGRALPKVLMIDSEPEVVYRLTELLSTEFAITVESNPEHALRRIKEERFDAIITDLDTQKNSGRDIVGFIEANAPEVPVFIVSNKADIDMSVAPFLRSSGVIQKPLVDTKSVVNTLKGKILTFYS